MTRPNKHLNEKILLDELREVILREDREALTEIENTLNDPRLLSEKVNPIIEQHLEFLKSEFPDAYRTAVGRQIDARLELFKDEMIGHMYPEMGKIVRKYVTHQFQLLKERIDGTVRNTFSLKTVKRKFKATFLGIDESDLVLTGADSIKIEEIYVIQRNSGLLLGKAAREEVLDQDVVAGMLTAIKSFVEDAFRRDSEDLEMIQYGSYKIFIQNFHSYYIAVAMQGSLSASESDVLSTKLLKFAHSYLEKLENITDLKIRNISTKLYENFIKDQ